MKDRREGSAGGRCPLWSTLAVALLVVTPLAAQEAELARGNFLVASRSLRDPNFVQTVILLLEYSSDGAMGVIINRPTEMKLSAMLPEVESLEQRPDTVWLGGPVSRWQMLLLTRAEQELEGARNVLGDIYFSASRVVLESLVAEDAEFRVYAGYAGWSPGQLDQEMTRGGWLLFPGDAAMVFDEAPEELWKDLVQRADVKWVSREVPEGGGESRAR